MQEWEARHRRTNKTDYYTREGVRAEEGIVFLADNSQREKKTCGEAHCRGGKAGVFSRWGQEDEKVEGRAGWDVTLARQGKGRLSPARGRNFGSRSRPRSSLKFRGDGLRVSGRGKQKLGQAYMDYGGA